MKIFNGIHQKLQEIKNDKITILFYLFGDMNRDQLRKKETSKQNTNLC